MPEILEIEQVMEERTESNERNLDSWTVEIPKEIITAQGLLDGTLVTLTYKSGKVEVELIEPSAKLREISNQIIKQRREAYEEMKRIGD